MPSDHIRLYMPPSLPIPPFTAPHLTTPHMPTHPAPFPLPSLPPTGGGSDRSTVHRHTEPHQRARAWEAESVQRIAIKVRTLRSDSFLFCALLYCMI